MRPVWIRLPVVDALLTSLLGVMVAIGCRRHRDRTLARGWESGDTHIETFYVEHFNPYLNSHRPCGVPEVRTNAEGKQRRVYRWYATPWEIPRQLPDLARHLRPEMTIAELERRAKAESDTEAARKMQRAKHRLFAGLHQGSSA